MSEKGIVKLVPRALTKESSRELTACSNCGHVEPSDARPTSVNPYSRWVGRIVIFELSTGTRVQGQILGMSDEWIDTDNGAVKIEHIVHAKRVSDEEARIIRGGPLKPSW